MPKHSAGLLVYRRQGGKLEVLLEHPGGPFWANKDEGVWIIPKGEYDNEDALEAAKREFREELGQSPPRGEYQELGEVKAGNKINKIWAVEGNVDTANVKSNTFELEWPPKSGRTQKFPEVDRAEWFDLATAKRKLRASQLEFLVRLEKFLDINPASTAPPSLF